MRHFEFTLPVEEDKDGEHEHEHGAEYSVDDLAREIYDWMKSENMREASLHVLWSDFPLKRHIENSRKWARILLKGEQLQLWDLQRGRQKGSKKIKLDVRTDSTNNPED